MLARMEDWPALMAVLLWRRVEIAVAFGAAVMLPADATAELSAALLVTTGTR